MIVQLKSCKSMKLDVVRDTGEIFRTAKSKRTKEYRRRKELEQRECGS